MAMRENKIRIILSYHRHNIEWRDLFVERLKPFQEKGPLYIFDDEVTDASQTFAANQKDLPSFNIIILFISQKYISLNNLVGKEIPEKILPLQKRGIRVVPLYLEDCFWQSISWLREMKLWPSPQLPFSNMSENEKEKYISRFIKDELKLAGAEEGNQKNKSLEDHAALQNDFIKFLKRKKGYRNSIMIMQEREVGIDDRGIDKGIRQYLAIFEHEKQKLLAIVEFGLNEDNSTIQMGWQQFMYVNRNVASSDIEGYVVFPDDAGLGEEFSIIKLDKDSKKYESILCEDFPTYEDLRRKRENETEASGGEDGDWFEQKVAKLEKEGFIFSFETKNIMKIAMQLALQNKSGKWELHTHEILIAIAYAGQRKESEYNTARLVLEKLRSNKSNYLEDYFIMIDSETGIDEIVLGKILERTGYVGDALREAKRFAVSTTDKIIIQIRHLLAALLFFRAAGKATRGAHSVIEKAGIELPTFMREFKEYVTNKFKEDNTEAWGKIFGELKQEATSQKYTLSKFKTGVDYEGSQICDKIIDLAGDSNFGLYAEDTDRSYVNLRLAGSEKTDNVAVQIHKYGEYETTIALAVVGPKKGVEVSEPELTSFVTKGEIAKLSGYKADIPGEKAWLNGNLPKAVAREKASVYVIEPEILDSPDAWNDVNKLLELAKKNAEIGKAEGIVSKILKVFGKIATLRSDEVSDVDDLGRETLIDAFADTIIHTDFNNGFTLALMGNWGEGKSSIMEILKRKLKELQKGRFDFALFNAWQYEQTGKTAAGLAQEVVKGLREKNFFKRQLQRVAFAYKENKLSLVIPFCLLISPFLLYLLRHYYDLTLLTDYLNNKPELKKLFGDFINAIYVILPLFGIHLFKKNTEHPLDIKLQTYFKLPDYGEHLGLIPVLKRHITTLCKLKLKRSRRIPFTDRKIGRDRKLLVFVDDLDRCKSGYIAETLDAIRLVMTIPNVIVMICIDHRIAFKAIERHYRTLAEVEEEDGNRRSSAEVARDYLGKIIQLPVRLEPVKHRKLNKYVYEKLFLFEKEEWEHFEERPELPIVTPLIETSVIENDRVSEIDTLEEVEGETFLIGEKVQGVDVPMQNIDYTLKTKQEKSKKGRKSDDKKSDDIEIKDSPEESKEFYRLAGLFEFNNPRQLLRLHNSFRFLKALGRGGENDTLDMLRMLFWQEFLHNWPIVIRHACMAVLIDEVHAEKVKPIARRVLNKVREDIIKLFDDPENYAELAEFVRIVVLPHNEEGIIDTKEEINEWLKKQAELAKKAQGSQGN